jgi:SAM-dependent methyltransferase
VSPGLSTQRSVYRVLSCFWIRRLIVNDWYDEIGKGYTDLRVPEPRISRLIVAALGEADCAVNIGAGTGSYEPQDMDVVAIEPSTLMLGQYQGSGMRIQASAENLPIADDVMDASMAVLTLHHWQDWRQGLSEMLRVSTRRAVIYTHTPDLSGFWLFDYFPEIREIDLRVFPSLDDIENAANECGWAVEVIPVPIPSNCSDGFLGAYWRRPEAYLLSEVRRSISSFNMLDSTLLDERLALLRRDLDAGEWQRRYGGLYDLEELDLGYRILSMGPDETISRISA